MPSPSRPGPPIRRSPRWGLRVSALTAGVVLAVSGFGHTMMDGVGARIDRVDPFKDLADRPDAGKGRNFLVVGVDNRDDISDEDKRAYHLGGDPCRCTDTMMLVHLSENADRASVVSLPRDSRTTLPAHVDESGERHAASTQKLNAAYSHGGPELTVRTVEKMTGVHVHHYLEVDFTSFMRTVDALGGVQVCTVRPLKDSYSGLDLPVGTTRLNGGEALQYVRARYVDGAADLGRMQRQQRFVASVIDRATSSGVLMNPVRLQQVASAVLSSVRADHGFGTEEMLALGQAMRGFSPSSSEFTTVPIGKAGHNVPGVGETVVWHPEKSERLFAALREDRPLTPERREPSAEPKRKATGVEVAPRNIRVQVDNGTGTPGLGHRADEQLRATGFDTTGIPGNAPEQDVEKTVITHDPGWDRSARSLSVALDGAELREVEGQGPLMKVTLGKDFRKVKPVREAAPEPDPSALIGGVPAVRGDDVTCT